MRTSRTRRALAAFAVAALLCPLAACADDDDPIVPSSTAQEEPTASASPSADSFLVTIEQSAGNVTIPSAPSRVVALDFPSADAAIALGVIPVGMSEVTYVDGGVQEWTKDAIGSAAVPTLFNSDAEFPFETLAELDPDVLLATNTYPLVEESWEMLNAIAPVVAHDEGPGSDDWQDGFSKIALALGKTADGDRLIAESQDALADVRSDHPEFEDKTASFFNYVAGDGLYVISSNSDVSMRFLQELGFAGAPEDVLELGEADGAQYDGTSSSSEPDPLNDLEESSLFTRVPAVSRGSFLSVGIGPATALAFPSVLSVQWAFRELIDDLADAVKADEQDESSSASS